jgi:hypothetical protein
MKHTANVPHYVHRSNKWSDYPTAAPSGPFRFEINSFGNIKPLDIFQNSLVGGRPIAGPVTKEENT